MQVVNEVYVVTRTYSCDLDSSTTTWYTLFMSFDFDKAKNYLDNVDMEEFSKIYLCEVPLDTNLDIISWEKYIVTGRTHPDYYGKF